MPQDIGFDGISPEPGTDDNVINRYFDVYFPRAIETAAALRAQNVDLSYVWTTQAWFAGAAATPALSSCSKCTAAQRRAGSTSLGKNLQMRSM